MKEDTARQILSLCNVAFEFPTIHEGWLGEWGKGLLTTPC